MWETIIGVLSDNLGFTLIGALTLIQIAPIKINPWSTIVSFMHQSLFGSIEKKLTDIDTKVDKLESKVEEREAVQARTHILRFNDELHAGVRHSNEYFLQIIDDIQTYDTYCREHKEFANGRTIMSCENIKDIYKKLCEEHKI